MSDGLPTKKSDWKNAANVKKIGHTQALATGEAFVSASKFEFEHFLRLRVLYTERNPPKDIVTSSGFPSERLEEVVKSLWQDANVLFLKAFLKDKRSLEKDWDVDKAKRSGIFAVAMELLHLIASRKLREMGQTEDTTNNKIELSPGKPRTISQLAHYRPRLDSAVEPSTPTRKPSGYYYESPSSDVPDVSGLSFDEPGKGVDQIRSELRREEENFERSEFSTGDEQTLNAALVALIMALSWLLKFTGRVHHDRASFTIQGKDSDKDLYKACVDGLITHLKEEKCNGFMEVKRDYRGKNSPVRRQISAQMAAFIYVQDIARGEVAVEKAAQEVTKGKGKKAKAKDGQGNQKQ